MSKPKVDKAIFWPSILSIIAVSIPLVMFPKEGEQFLNKLLSYITHEIGWFYMYCIFGCMIFLGWLAFSKYGKIKLGHGKPQFSTMSWVAMLFCASIGSSILYWGSIEWAYYYMTPPFGAEPFSIEAAEWASTYGLFHWGISAWTTYCLSAVVVGYFYYVRKIPVFRLSTTCVGVIGEKNAKGTVGKIIDIFVIFGLLSGVATSLGLGTPMVAEGIGRLLGIKPSLTLDIIIILIWGSMFGASVFLGLEKGIKNLSNINIAIAVGLLSFILIVGPTSFIMNTFTNSIGKMFQNFIQMSFYTDPIAKSGFPQDWTAFYWAWWIVYIPVVGLFIAKISKGRTLKQVILGSTLFGSLGCWIFFAVFGNYALFLQLNGIKDVAGILSDSGGPVAIMAILETLPFAKIVIFVFIVLAFISLATSFDSAAYILSSIATKELKDGEEPARWHRVFWAFAITVLPIVLMFLGGLKTLQISSVVGSVPLVAIIFIMVVSFVKNLKEDYAKGVLVQDKSTDKSINGKKTS